MILGILLSEHVPRDTFDVVVAVPVATPRLRQRGYNQAEVIARQVSKELRVPYRQALWRARTTQQVGKTRSERLAGVEGVFGTRGNLRGKSVLLVDDVVTTGATLNACATALRVAGAAATWGAVAGRD